MNDQRAITKQDVETGRTFYIKHCDTDANTIRFVGPMFLGEAQLRVNELILLGHKASVIDTPKHVQLAAR